MLPHLLTANGDIPLGHVRVDDLSEGETRAFAYLDGMGLREEAFVLRRRGALHVFVNRCPHWMTRLEDARGGAYDRTRDVILCPRHGARFDARTGECQSGPPEGGRIKQLPYRVEGQFLVVEPPEDEWVDDE